MRPQITYPKSLARALNYHEKKVQKGDATLLHAHNFFKAPAELNFHDKKERFADLMALNERAVTKLIHLSLNFHPSEAERMTPDFYVRLADEYMQKIGFGDQPYLVYQHNDAGHPHIHILSSLIDEDGRRLSTHNMAKNRSEPARKELEKTYGLVSADKKEQQAEKESGWSLGIAHLPVGRSATLRTITNVLDKVLDRYHYASFEQFNAILQCYHIRADRGAENGRIYANKGLTYAVIDDQGKAITKPIKASIIYSKPTLVNLEKRFAANEQKQTPDKKPTRDAIERAFRSAPRSLSELAAALQKARMDLVVRRNADGRVFGITYVHHARRKVFNGSELGPEYAAKKLLERLAATPVLQRQSQQQSWHTRAQDNAAKGHPGNKQGKTSPPAIRAEKEQTTLPDDLVKAAGKIIEQVVHPDTGESWAINKELLTDQRRKKKKGFDKQWEM